MAKFKESKAYKYVNVRTMTANGLIAALYAVVTIACGPLSYSFMQFRFSEALNLLVFFNPSYTVGLTIGCLIANLFSSVGTLDIALGTATTLVACILMSIYSRYIKNLFFSGLFPCLANAAIVPLTIYWSSLGSDQEMSLSNTLYWTMFGWVLLGEVVAIYGLGYPLFMVLSKKNRMFYPMILATRNTDFRW